jgi:hypothetical protein
MEIRESLLRYLKRRKSNAGRESSHMLRLSDMTGISVHHLQSVAYGRRGLSKENKALLRQALKDSRNQLAEYVR